MVVPRSGFAELASIDQEVRATLCSTQSLWPDKFEFSADGAWKFCLHQHTWNEAEGEVQPFPGLEFLEYYTHAWWDCFVTGQTLISEKCRRMTISWNARELELFVMGFKRTDCILVGEDLESAAKHVWRLKFLYEQMQQRYSSWHLPTHTELRFEGERKLKAFGLANGSVTNYANGQASGLQGDGTKIITLEELGIYRYAGTMLAQAKILTQGSGKSSGGFVNCITNASANTAWQLIKKGHDEGDRGPDTSDWSEVSQNTPLR